MVLKKIRILVASGRGEGEMAFEGAKGVSGVRATLHILLGLHYTTLFFCQNS